MNKEGSIKSRLTVIIRSASFRKSFLGIIVGGLFGFLYFYFVGCKTGSCSITSDPYGSIITGALLGFLLAGSSTDNKTKEHIGKQEE
jgi:hypothetical protein